jgi:ribosome-binding protein aMBF1 (putative translation factor)
MTPDQLRAARALLGWSQMQLGLRSDTSIHVVRTFEQTGWVMTVQRRPDLTDPLAAIRAALEAAGVEFTNGDVPGVQLRKQSS